MTNEKNDKLKALNELKQKVNKKYGDKALHREF